MQSPPRRREWKSLEVPEQPRIAKLAGITGKEDVMSKLTTIHYTIDQTTQKAAIKAGLDGSQEQTVESDLSTYIDREVVYVECDGGLSVKNLTMGCGYKNRIWADQNKILSGEEAAEILVVEAEKSLRKKKEEERKAIEAKELRLKKVAEWDQKFLPLIEAYENGGNMPKWDGDWKGSHNLKIRIIEETEKRGKKEKEDCDARKVAQLSEAVKHFGSDSQKERWEADVMPRREVLDLIWNRWVEPLHNAGLEPLHNAWHIAGYEDDFNESEKETLTDSQWAIVKKVKAVMPEAELEYYHQYSDDEDVQGCDLIRISQKIGEYDFECDIVFPED